MEKNEQNMLGALPPSRNFSSVLVCLVQVAGVDEESLKYFHVESPLYHVLLQKSFLQNATMCAVRLTSKD